MCGIVGFAGHTIAEADLRRAVESLRHRGPDGHGLFLDPEKGVGLGHARLSIIDLATGAQPLYSEDGDLVLVCNGEIYEHEVIRAELEARGHRFRTRSDSEVILHLYEDRGLDCVDRLRGEFAFLLYDARAGLLRAARDRFGIKPLFYNEQDGRFLFASEAKALFATGRLRPRINPVTLRDYLSGAFPDSVFEGVEAVPPGCVLTVDPSRRRSELTRYWDVDLPHRDPDPPPELADCVRAVRDGVEEAVRLRMRADVPVGVYLSGGIDSAIVAAAAARHHPGPLKAFTIVFPEEDAFNESEPAAEMARHIGADLHSVTCDHDRLLRHLEDCLWIGELPCINLHGVGKYLLSALAREHVKVVLTGEGSDEIFMGYLLFQTGQGTVLKQMVNRLEAHRPPPRRDVKRVIDALGFLPLEEHARSLSPRMQWALRGLFDRRHRARLASNHPLDRMRRRLDRHQTDGRPRPRQSQYFWIKSMLAPYLLSVLGDRAELAHGIEGRTPFLDHRLFDTVRTVPDGYKIRDGVEKYVLREAFKDRLPETLYRRRKWPYFAPTLPMKTGHLPELDRLLERYLSREALDRSGLFSPGKVRLMLRLRRGLTRRGTLSLTLDILLLFILSVQILDARFVHPSDPGPAT